MPHAFRFGVQTSSLPITPGETWIDSVRRIEALGYDTLFWPDHFTPMWEPTAALSAVGAVTERLKVGSLVYGIDYRHPVVLAKASATIQLLTGGRHEFGLGAGWTESDYVEAGMDFAKASVRIERLEEALTLIRQMWSVGPEERTSFEGVHYQLRGIAQAVPLGDLPPPRILVGGGGPRLLAVAGRHADIVGINPKVSEGRVTARTMQDGSAEQTHRKIGWLHEAASAAGRDPASLELNCLIFATAITDDPRGLQEGLAKASGMSVDDVATCPLYLIGSASEIRDRLEQRREEFGFSYVVIQARDAATVEGFAEHVVEPLAGR